MLPLNDVESADTRPDMNPYPRRYFRSDLQAGRLHRLIRGRQGQVDKARHFLELFLFDELQRFEVLDFGRNLAGKLWKVFLFERALLNSFLNACPPALARQQALPHLFCGVAYRTDQAQASNYDSPTQLLAAFPVFS